MTDLTFQVEQLGRASRRAAIISLVGVGILAVSFGASFWKLRGAEEQAIQVRRQVETSKRHLETTIASKAALQREVEAAILNRESLTRDIDAKTKELETLTRAQIETKELLAKQPSNALATDVRRALDGKSRIPTSSPPLSAAEVQRSARVNLSLQSTNELYQGRPIYNVKIWVSMPKELAATIVKAEFFFPHPSFVPQTRSAFPAGGFSLSYRGYGCVDATATLVEVNGNRHKLPFDMCTLWSAAKPKL
jgi:hypothetical protein